MTEKKSIVAFIVGAIVGATIASQVLLLTWARQYRGEVYTIPMAPNSEYKVTAHNGRVYAMVESPRIPQIKIEPDEAKGKAK